MKNVLTFLFFVILIAFSCKKKEQQPPTGNSGNTGNTVSTTGSGAGTTTGSSGTTGGSTTGGSTTGGSTTGGSTTGGSTGGTLTPNEQPVHGILTIRTLTLANATPVVNATEAEAFFSGASFTEVTPSLGINVGNVSLNGSQLSFNQPTLNTYFLGSVSSAANGNWSVSGGNGVPGFTFNSTFGHPVCHNPEVLPDEISVTSGATIALSISDFNYGMLLFTVENSGIKMELGFGFTGSAPIQVGPQDLELLGEFDKAEMTLLIENSITTNINGRELRFERESVIRKNVILTP